MNVDIKIERSVEIAASDARVRVLLDDLEGTLKRFPKLRRLTRIGDDGYLWEMKPIGSKAARISHEVVYAARYQVDMRKQQVRWVPVAGKGNATIEGELRLEPQGATTRLSFQVQGRLRDVPVPLMYRLLAPAFIQGKFTRLVDTFLEETREAVIAG